MMNEQEAKIAKERAERWASQSVRIIKPEDADDKPRRRRRRPAKKSEMDEK